MEERQMILICSLLGAVVLFFLIYFVLKPKKWVYIVLILGALVVLYGIQPVTWEEEENTTVLGYTVYSERTLYSQCTLFGAVPIGNVIELKKEKAVLREAAPIASLAASAALTFIPGSGFIRLTRLFSTLSKSKKAAQATILVKTAPRDRPAGAPTAPTAPAAPAAAGAGGKTTQVLAETSPSLFSFFMSYFDGREEQKTGEKDQARPAQGQQALPKNADIVLTE